MARHAANLSPRRAPPRPVRDESSRRSASRSASDARVTSPAPGPSVDRSARSALEVASQSGDMGMRRSWNAPYSIKMAEGGQGADGLDGRNGLDGRCKRRRKDKSIKSILSSKSKKHPVGSIPSRVLFHRIQASCDSSRRGCPHSGPCARDACASERRISDRTAPILPSKQAREHPLPRCGLCSFVP